jgi:hypothetical protein
MIRFGATLDRQAAVQRDEQDGGICSVKQGAQQAARRARRKKQPNARTLIWHP